MSDPVRERPRQVTMAGWLIMGGGVAVIVAVFDQITRLRSLDTRTSVERMLADQPMQGLGLSVDDVLSAMHVLALIAAGCATAAVILGWQALRRSRSARVALTILAPPLLIAGFSSGGLFSTLVAIAVAMLWLQPARDWYAGRAPSVPPAPPAPPAPSASAMPTAQPQPPASTPPSAYASKTPARRPGSVTAAAVLTWVFSALTLLVVVGSLAWALGDTGEVWRQVTAREPDLVDQGFTQQALVAAMSVMVVLIGLYCLAAAVVAFFVLRRAAWARVTLIVLVGIAAAALAVGSLVSGVCAVPLTGAVVTLALLLRADTTRWFAPPGPGSRP